MSPVASMMTIQITTVPSTMHGYHHLLHLVTTRTILAILFVAIVPLHESHHERTVAEKGADLLHSSVGALHLPASLQVDFDG